MSKLSAIFSQKLLHSPAEILISLTSTIIFVFLDFLDTFLCIIYGFIDEFFEGKSSSCYCMASGSSRSPDEAGEERGINGVVQGEDELSETLHRRRNIFRQMGFHRIVGIRGELSPSSSKMRESEGPLMKFVNTRNRWSDCGCQTCISWMKNAADFRLHVAVKEPSIATARLEDSKGEAAENVVFIHGFLSSSSFWTETVFPNLSEHAQPKYRFFAVDLLGFGRSPKPRDCLYTINDHLTMIENSVIKPFHLDSFHLVAHSMGCILALALASKYNESVKSIILIAPPYVSSSKEDPCLSALDTLAARRIWPPLSIGSAVMSWYEHIGRCVCFLICRNHRTWEWILKLITRRRDLHFMVADLTRHTHHSAWHTMHNVICGGAKLTDKYLENLRLAGVKINVIHGTEDEVVPPECSYNLKVKIPDAEINIIADADHNTVILAREKEFTWNAEQVWASVKGKK